MEHFLEHIQAPEEEPRKNPKPFRFVSSEAVRIAGDDSLWEMRLPDYERGVALIRKLLPDGTFETREEVIRDIEILSPRQKFTHTITDEEWERGHEAA